MQKKLIVSTLNYTFSSQAFFSTNVDEVALNFPLLFLYFSYSRSTYV
jgi:hypothetical protein